MHFPVVILIPFICPFHTSVWIHKASLVYSFLWSFSTLLSRSDLPFVREHFRFSQMSLNSLGLLVGFAKCKPLSVCTCMHTYKCIYMCMCECMCEFNYFNWLPLCNKTMACVRHIVSLHLHFCFSPLKYETFRDQ